MDAAAELAWEGEIADEARLVAAAAPSAAAVEESTGSATFFSPPLAGEIGTFGTVRDVLEAATSLFEGAATDVVDVDWM